MSVHVMLDLETLGVRPDAAVLQIGAVMFEPRSGGKLYDHGDLPFNRYVAIQDNAGTIDHSTLLWWFGQDGAARERLVNGLKGAKPLNEVLSRFADWVTIAGQKVGGVAWSNVHVWAHGASFDPPVIASAFARFGAGTPWNYNKVLDTRTLFKLVSGPPDVELDPKHVPHDALCDAVRQAQQVQKALGILKRDL